MGLRDNHEISPSHSYCNTDCLYPCTPGVDYYGRGALHVCWNYNYGIIGDRLKVDLVNHPEFLEQNAALAFQAAMWRWMNQMKKKQSSAHDVFIGNWKRRMTLAKRLSSFGTTMNILYGDEVCGQDSIEAMNNIIFHYQYYLDLMGVEGSTLETIWIVLKRSSSTHQTNLLLYKLWGEGISSINHITWPRW